MSKSLEEMQELAYEIISLLEADEINVETLKDTIVRLAYKIGDYEEE